MLIESKTSKMHANKTFELRSGINGSGKEVRVIQTVIGGNCAHSETFTNIAEANSWFKHACN